MHETVVPEGESRDRKNIWRNNRQNIFKFDENYKSTDQGSSMKPQQDKHQRTHTSKDIQGSTTWLRLLPYLKKEHKRRGGQPWKQTKTEAWEATPALPKGGQAPSQTHASTQHCQVWGSRAECRNQAALAGCSDHTGSAPLTVIPYLPSKSPDCHLASPLKFATGRKSASQRVPMALSTFLTLNHQSGILLPSPQKPANCTCPWEVTLLSRSWQSVFGVCFHLLRATEMQACSWLCP